MNQRTSGQSDMARVVKRYPLLQNPAWLPALIALVIVVLALTPSGAVSALVGREPATTASGLEASSARWTAWGQYYTRSREASAAADAARWTALAEHYPWQRGRAADAARWRALGRYYAPDYELIAEVSSARYQALATWYARRAAQQTD